MNPLHRLTWIGITAGFLFCLYASNYWSVSDGLRVSFLDIGQGDSILIQTPHGRKVIIDGGPGTTILERLGEELSFWTKQVDLLILTHPDLDHLEGFLEVLPRYEVKRILVTGVFHDSELYKAFLNLIREQNIPTSFASPEQDWQIDDGVYLDIIAPVESVAFEEVESTNDTSIVAKLVYGNTSLLLTGDGEWPEENSILLTDSDLRSQLLKGGHHGSRTSNAVDFLRAIQPTKAVMINGGDNQFGHPHLETVLRFDDFGVDWWNTKDEGTVRFVSNADVWRRVDAR